MPPRGPIDPGCPAARGVLAALAGLLLAVVAARPVVAQEVEVELDRFGVGSVYRPGDFAGIEVTLRDRRESAGATARNVLVQWEVVNADGDVAEHVRLAGGLPPGGVRRTWLYAPLPPDTDEESIFRLRVFEEADGQRGRELGGARISPVMTGGEGEGGPARSITAQLVEARTALFGVVGDAGLSLDDYEPLQSSRTGLEVVTSHDAVEVVRGLRIEDLPDHRLGLEPFQLLAFGPDVQPRQLGLRRAEAIRAWVRGGGHLVVVLDPEVDAWGIGPAQTNELDDLLPGTAPEVGDTTIAEALEVLGRSRRVEGPRARQRLQVAVFDDLRGPDGRPGVELPPDWAPITALPDGRVFVVERRFGHGRITLVGLDLASNALRNLTFNTVIRGPAGTTSLVGDLPEADVFWNPILGRRGDTPSPTAVELLAGERRLRQAAVPEVLVGGAETILGDIEMAEDAEKGLLMALLLFVAYWFVAGPLGFLWLRSQGRVKQAWLGFAAAAAIFTFLAWAGVGLIRKRETDVRHLTFLDQVHQVGPLDPADPPLTRATAWMTVYLPGYGGETLSLAGTESDPAGVQRQLHARIPPGGQSRPFPNAARYPVPTATEPDEIRLPSRSTTTILKADWLGVLDPGWGRTFEVDVDDPVRVEIGPDGRERLAGTVRSLLPGRLVEVMLIFVHASRLEVASYVLEDGMAVPRVPLTQSGGMSHVGDLWRLGADGWIAGDALDLATLDRTSRLSLSLDQRYVDPFEQDRGRGGFGVSMIDRGERRRLQEMLGVFDQLTPPRWMRDDGQGAEEPTVRLVRLLGRDVDLSDWLSRPCLIVAGRLEDAPTPIPLTAGGEEVRGTGDVVVRWIHPLPQAPELAFDDVFRTGDPAGDGEAAPAGE